VSQERWLSVPHVLLIEENDGARFLRKGAERNEEAMTWRAACAQYPRLAQILINEMQQLLDASGSNSK